MTDMEIHLAIPLAHTDKRNYLRFRLIASREMRCITIFGDLPPGFARWENGVFECGPPSRLTSWKPTPQLKRREMAAKNF
ncbi:MAG: hypothetical protein OXC72_07380 [Roseovarius sp.]|nr:hypothetical protein [Roseovarius sp.]